MDDSTSGRWTSYEHNTFVQGLNQYGRDWKKIRRMVPTRTVVQIRTHAQKYFQKVAREEGLGKAQDIFRGGYGTSRERLINAGIIGKADDFVSGSSSSSTSGKVLKASPESSGATGSRSADAGAKRRSPFEDGDYVDRTSSKRNRVSRNSEQTHRADDYEYGSLDNSDGSYDDDDSFFDAEAGGSTSSFVYDDVSMSRSRSSGSPTVEGFSGHDESVSAHPSLSSSESVAQSKGGFGRANFVRRMPLRPNAPRVEAPAPRISDFDGMTPTAALAIMKMAQNCGNPNNLFASPHASQASDFGKNKEITPRVIQLASVLGQLNKVKTDDILTPANATKIFSAAQFPDVFDSARSMGKDHSQVQIPGDVRLPLTNGQSIQLPEAMVRQILALSSSGHTVVLNIAQLENGSQAHFITT